MGEPIKDRHICTIQGNPRPKVEVRGLPPGVTLTRGPTENDTWLVLNGTFREDFFGVVEVTASLPNGWADTK